MPASEWDPNVALQSGAGSAQPYDPFSLEPSFASSKFIASYTTMAGYQAGYSGAGEGKKSVAITGAKQPQYAQVGFFFQNLAKSPRQILEMQRKLQANGLLEKGGYLEGVLDNKTQGLLEFVIQTAIGSNKSFDQAFAMILKAGKKAFSAAQAAARPQFKPPPMVKADPEAVDDLVDKAFQQATGRIPNSKERTRLTSVFRSWERRAYGQQVKAARAQFYGGKATVTDIQPETHVAESAETVGGGETATYQLSQVLSAMAQGIGGGNG
jgi:hypothetical protein